MEQLLNEHVSQEDLNHAETKYRNEMGLDGEVTVETKFEYAISLVRSPYSNDVAKGISLLEDLSRVNPDGKRDYIYYLAFGNARLKNYTEGLKYCSAFLEIEPNDQVRQLEEYIRKQRDKEMAKGIAVAGGAMLVLGGIVSVGMALARNKKKSDQ